jgi:1,4-dihydroxy-2-naphthoate octaprenyltransferase
MARSLGGPGVGRRPNRWVAGARPRTLAASVVPVLVGTAAAHRFIAWRFVAALVVALAIQVGTNYANDYGDGVRGADERRVGPVRLVASGLASPEAVRRAAIVAFGVAVVAGTALAAAAGWWLIGVGAASVAAGWLYTAGPRPYGYAGLGEVFVFVFFGLVATVGSAYVQDERFSAVALAAAVPVGMLATALLVVNNLRDLATDAAVGKRTLAVRLGDRATRRLYLALMSVAAPVAVRPMRAVAQGAAGPALVTVLVQTARAQVVFGVALAGALWWAR